jgi:hypothetical protein
MMTPNSAAARELAERLLASGGPRPPAEEGAGPLAAAGRVDRHLAAELSRWFGPYGYHALLTRAIAQARTEHLALAMVRAGPPETPSIDGLADAAQAHGAPATLAGVTAVLATLIELLGRLIGADLAMTFIDRTIVAMAPATAADATTPGATGRPSLESAE